MISPVLTATVFNPAPRAIEILSSAGFKKMKNLKGGINAWAEEVGQSLPLY